MTRAIENHWVFGYGAHIEFPNGGEPISLPLTSIRTEEGSASISDINGNLLFYTDGSTLWNAIDVPIPTTLGGIPTTLGGNSSSTSSAIIIPPTGTGTLYHIFCVDANNSNGGPSDISYSTCNITGGTISSNDVTIITGELLSDNLGGSLKSTERIVAISKDNCEGYWLITQELDIISENNANNFHVFSVDNNGATYDHTDNLFGSSIWNTSRLETGYLKFSHDGTMLVSVDCQENEIIIYDFDISNAAISFNNSNNDRRIKNIIYPYGIEFSPDSKIMYFSAGWKTRLNRVIYQYDLTSLSPTPMRITSIVDTSTNKYWALQLGPNNKIYATNNGYNTLSVIENPNIMGIGCTFTLVALDNNGLELSFDNPVLSQAGLPTFVRLSDSCQRVSESSICETLVSEVNEILEEQTNEYENSMEHCDGTAGSLVNLNKCDTLEIPELKPTYHITYGDSYCDCIESDDIETMTITICNPYNNISFDNVIISSLVLVDENGDPVATLPNGDPSGEIVPIGPYCFGTIDSCSCISREFSFRSRGMIAGKYKIIAKGICFDVNIHQDDQACFIFDICKD